MLVADQTWYTLCPVEWAEEAVVWRHRPRFHRCRLRTSQWEGQTL